MRRMCVLNVLGFAALTFEGRGTLAVFRREGVVLDGDWEVSKW